MGLPRGPQGCGERDLAVIRRSRLALAPRARGSRGANGNPSMDNLAVIFDVVRRQLGVNLQAQAVEAA